MGERDIMSRVVELENWRRKTDEWKRSVEENNAKLDDMIELFTRIENSLWLFVKIGNAIKWAVGTVAAVAGALYALTHLGMNNASPH